MFVTIPISQVLELLTKHAVVLFQEHSDPKGLCELVLVAMQIQKEADARSPLGCITYAMDCALQTSALDQAPSSEDPPLFPIALAVHALLADLWVIYKLPPLSQGCVFTGWIGDHLMINVEGG